MTAVHLQVVFCCALALCAAYFAAKFLAKYFDFSQGGPKQGRNRLSDSPFIYPGSTQIAHYDEDYL